MKEKVQLKNRRREKSQRKKRKNYEWREKRERGDNGQVLYGSGEHPSQKRHKKEKNNGHVSEGE
jgi:hypothetical protein